MEADTAKKVATLVQKRHTLAQQLEYVRDKTKEFTTLKVSGEDGAERTYALEFTYERHPEIVKAIREQLVVMLTKAIDAIDAEIADL